MCRSPSMGAGMWLWRTHLNVVLDCWKWFYSEIWRELREKPVVTQQPWTNLTAALCPPQSIRSSSDSSCSRPSSYSPGSPSRTICVSSSCGVSSSLCSNSCGLIYFLFILYLCRGVARTKCLSGKTILFASNIDASVKELEQKSHTSLKIRTLFL